LPAIGILVNPLAGGVRRDPDLPERLRRILGGRGDLVVAEGREEITRAVEGFRAQGVQVLGVVGGDGSNMFTLTAATHVFNGDLPPLAFLRGGSVNTVGRWLGLRGSPEQLLERLLRVDPRHPTVDLHTMRVNGNVGFVYGAALLSNFYKSFYQQKDKGFAGALLHGARSVLGSVFGTELGRSLYAPVRARIRTGGEEIPLRDYTLMMASTIPNLLGIKVTYRAQERPGCFHFVASGGSRPELARRFHKGLLGRPLGGTNHVDVVTERLEVEFQRPQTYTIDGDLYDGDRVVLEPGPRLTVLSL
jgi:diacylglycerol kinase family enzyme